MLVAEAKKEGKVVVYGPPGAEPKMALTEGFPRVFPGITVEFAGLALPGKAPHPHAARLYINGLLTKEGQTLLA